MASNIQVVWWHLMAIGSVHLSAKLDLYSLSEVFSQGDQGTSASELSESYSWEVEEFRMRRCRWRWWIMRSCWMSGGILGWSLALPTCTGGSWGTSTSSAREWSASRSMAERSAGQVLRSIFSRWKTGGHATNSNPWRWYSKMDGKMR